MTQHPPMIPKDAPTIPGSHEDRLRQLERRRKKGQVKPADDKIAQALRALRHGDQKDPAAADFREELFAELRKLIPVAMRQARAGKPALLRILTRYGR